MATFYTFFLHIYTPISELINGNQKRASFSVTFEYNLVSFSEFAGLEMIAWPLLGQWHGRIISFACHVQAKILIINHATATVKVLFSASMLSMYLAHQVVRDAAI